MRTARLVQIALLGLFTLIGLVATLAVAADWLQGLDTWFWRETTCVIESSEGVRRPEYGDSVFRVSYRYRFHGESHLGDAYRHEYSGSEELSEARVLASRYPVGSEVSCWVDPDEPDRAYLHRSNAWRGIWILVPLLFVGVGAGSLWLLHWRDRSSDPAAADRTGASLTGTAKPALGLGLLIVFFGGFLLFGFGFLIPFFIHPALQVVEARSWAQVPCEIVSSGVRSHPGEDSATYSIDLLYRYEIDGREYRSNRYEFMSGSSSGYERRARVVEALAPGTTTACWVDPDDPFEAVIERGFTSDYLFGLVPLLFTLIGVGGLFFAIGALRAARKAAARSSWIAAPATSPASASAWFSWAPAAADTPTVSGPLVLEPAMGPIGKLGCAVGVTLFWNGIVWLFVWHIVEQWRSGHAEWFAAVVITPFALIGLLLLASIPYSILALLNPRPRVRLDPATLRVGDSARLEWTFRGLPSRIRRLRIWLEASESRTRTSESGVRLETKPLDTPRIEIVDRQRDPSLDSGGASFTVPDGTPPSTSGEPSIRWRLKLHGEIGCWPDVVEEYEVPILPERS